MTMEMNGINYQPLSMVANNMAGFSHPVYITGRWCQFLHNGRQIQRVVRVANEWLKYVTFKGKRYYIDDSCTLR